MKLLGTPLTELVEMIKKKKISSAEVNSYFRKRIDTYDKDIKGFVTVNDNIEKPSLETKLAGVPIAVKDNFCTKGLRTTASSKVLENFIPPYDATVTKRLKDAGAVVQGKTNMDAWAHGSSTETSDFGPTRNPWDIGRVPGGSSGGSAAVVSAYLAPAAVGSETAGSIRGPASWCGIVGVKPTYGRVSRYGAIAMGSSLDCPGPMTLTVEDSALLLEILAGKDPYDATSATAPVGEYRKEMKKNRKLKIGISDAYNEGIEESVSKKVGESIKILEKMGHTVKKVKLIPPKYAISVYTIVQRAEVSSNLSRYDGVRFGNGRDTMGAEAKRRIMLGTYTLSHGFYDAYYKKAQKVRTLIIEDFKKAFEEIDVIVSPTMPVTAMKIGEFEKYPFFGEVMDVLAEPAAVAGIPGVSIPCGLDKNNLPVGMQFVGYYFSEGLLLDIAHQFEKETDFFGVIKKGVAKYKD